MTLIQLAKSVVLIGFSYGADLIANYLSKYSPTKKCTAVLMDPNIGPETTFISRLIAEAEEPSKSLSLDWVKELANSYADSLDSKEDIQFKRKYSRIMSYFAMISTKNYFNVQSCARDLLQGASTVPDKIMEATTNISVDGISVFFAEPDHAHHPNFSVNQKLCIQERAPKHDGEKDFHHFSYLKAMTFIQCVKLHKTRFMDG